AKPANLLISGGTGSGKTTLLNVLASFIPETERVVSIEDTAELKLPLEHWVRLEARPPGLEGTGEITLDILTKNSLRMRPDRILVGEIRHAEAFALFTAMNTGHEGCMGTVHANSPQETLVRVMSPPMNVPEVMLAGLNFVVIEHRLHDKKVGAIRRITEIAEVYGALEGKPTTETIYKRDASSDTLIRTKSHIQYLKVLEERTGLSQDQIAKELKRREVFLRELVAKKESNMDEVSRQMKEFLMRSEHG
ncbi:MAG: ATPase, T2SS/T4P/T4SS family, partial [Candidatus Diapherotrites archaeon]